MTLYLDPRDGSGDLIEYLTPRKAVVLTQLNSADVMFAGNGPTGDVLVGIEVKKLGDALQSMQNGRLVKQLGEMIEDYDVRMFLLEGHLRCSRTGVLQHFVRRQTKTGKWEEFWCDAYFGNRQTIMYSHFMTWVMSLCLGTGTWLLPSTGREETAQMIKAVQAFFDKPFAEHASLKVFDDSQTPGLMVPSVTMKVARDLAEGVGWEKAAAAADHFKTVKRMVTAAETDWLEVDGFGKELAKRMIAGINGEHVLRKRQRVKGTGGTFGSTHSNIQKSSSHRSSKRRWSGKR